MKIKDNITASLKLLQKELKDILENESLKVSHKSNVVSNLLIKINQVICLLQNDSK